MSSSHCSFISSQSFALWQEWVTSELRINSVDVRLIWINSHRAYDPNICFVQSKTEANMVKETHFSIIFTLCKFGLNLFFHPRQQWVETKGAALHAVVYHFLETFLVDLMWAWQNFTAPEHILLTNRASFISRILSASMVWIKAFVKTDIANITVN